MSDAVIAIIAVFALTTYVIIAGLTSALMYKFTSADNEDSNIAGAVWPLSLIFFIAPMLVKKLVFRLLEGHGHGAPTGRRR